MSLYYIQKFLFELNRSEELQAKYQADRSEVLTPYTLTTEETAALTRPDIGLLFHLGVNGQILMHFAAFHQIEWQDYLQLMRDGVATHGPVREGVYAMTGYGGTKAHASELGQAGDNSGRAHPPADPSRSCTTANSGTTATSRTPAASGTTAATGTTVATAEPTKGSE